MSRLKEIKKKPIKDLSLDDLSYLVQKIEQAEKDNLVQGDYNALLVHKNGYKQPFKIKYQQDKLYMKAAVPGDNDNIMSSRLIMFRSTALSGQTGIIRYIESDY